MKLFRLFATGKAECSEFRLTTARGFALLTYGVFAEAKPRQKRFELLLVNFHCAYLLHYPVKIVSRIYAAGYLLALTRQLISQA